ncbi:MAG TPA: OsmC family protein, partial [Candidatus Limnocylindrales bacterium]|nr:OsmC family protein [Candidatus Limnocylindrales bacterium]
DEGPVVGGRGQAPTPLTYFVASIGFAILTDLVRAFAIHDVEVDRLGLTIEAEFPLDAKYGASSGPVAATAIRYDVAIDSGASRPAVEAAVAWAERYCHAVQTVRQPVAVVGRYRLAGEELAGF